VVQLDRLAHPLPADSVTVDNRGAAKEGVSRLLAAGHRQVAIVAELETSPYGDLADFITMARKVRLDAQTLYPSWQRLLGFLEAHWEAGLEVDPRLVARVGAYSADGARRAVHTLLDSGPTAIFAADGVMSTGTVQALTARGAVIPRDVSLLCFDDLDWMDFYGPGLTTLAQPVREMGSLAARMLLERIGGDASPLRHTVLGAQLTERGSITEPLGAPTD
jgi:LacI family transcriptional regulator